MITYLVHHETALFWGWMLAFLIPGAALLRAALWPQRMPPENSGAIRARIERERWTPAPDQTRPWPVTATRPARRPASHRSAA
ncbi:hypothetical protein ACFRAQ_35585 [Nocardia sp. NPDC056611]|uniref:hypothetical protein n=1 Tax=Nocardia sp. NPDC056611 TaxID=3345877 RepID=UPI00366C57CD